MFRIGFIISITLHVLCLGVGSYLWISETKSLKQSAQRESHSHHGEVFKVTLKIKEEHIPEIQKVLEKKFKTVAKENADRVIKKVTKEKVVTKTSPQTKELSKSVARNKQEEKLGKEELEAYVMELRHFIEKQKFYPRKAARLKQTGEVEIDVEIDQFGHFVSVDIKKASRFSSLNSAAIKLLKEISKFKPLPQKMGEKITLSIPLKYQMK